jgi:hypothetical protein
VSRARVAAIIPVLGRPQNAVPVGESLLGSEAELRLELWFVVSPGDREQRQACLSIPEARVLEAPWPGGIRGDYARKINLGLWQTDTEFLLCGADDLRFELGWADRAVAVLEETGTGFCGTNDLANPLVKAGKHATHPVVRRGYALECGTIDAPGMIYHEGYWHQWVDNEATGTAMSRGCWSFCADAVVEHLHPIWGTARRDATYELGDLHRAEDLKLHHQRKRLWA